MPSVDLSQDLGPVIYPVVIIFTILATGFVIARTYTRTVILHSFGLDDAFIIAALVTIQMLNVNIDVTDRVYSS